MLGIYEYNLLSYGSLFNEDSLILKYRIIYISKETYNIVNKKEMLNINTPINNKKNDIGI